MPFQSFRWEHAEVLNEEMELLERLHDSEHPAAQRKSILIQLLDSASPAARGIAFDLYSRISANLRQGDHPMIDSSLNAIVRAAALRELRNPPSEAGEQDSQPRAGANHASALNALLFCVAPEDADLIARALSNEADEQVVEMGIDTAARVLRDAPAHAALVSALLHIAQRKNLPPRARGDAILAVGGVAEDSIEPILTEALADPVLEISAAAAEALLERNPKRHRLTVATTAAGWPTGANLPLSVDEVRRLLTSASASTDGADRD